MKTLRHWGFLLAIFVSLSLIPSCGAKDSQKEKPEKEKLAQSILTTAPWQGKFISKTVLNAPADVWLVKAVFHEDGTLAYSLKRVEPHAMAEAGFTDYKSTYKFDGSSLKIGVGKAVDTDPMASTMDKEFYEEHAQKIKFFHNTDGKGLKKVLLLQQHGRP